MAQSDGWLTMVIASGRLLSCSRCLEAVIIVEVTKNSGPVSIAKSLKKEERSH